MTTSFATSTILTSTLEADRISFSFSARKITIFRFSAFYFSAENRWHIFGFILFFGLIIPENCRKRHWADGQRKFWNLYFAATAATSLYAAWLTVYQQVAPVGLQSHGADYTALIMQQRTSRKISPLWTRPRCQPPLPQPLSRH